MYTRRITAAAAVIPPCLLGSRHPFMFYVHIFCFMYSHFLFVHLYQQKSTKEATTWQTVGPTDLVVFSFLLLSDMVPPITLSIPTSFYFSELGPPISAWRPALVWIRKHWQVFFGIFMVIILITGSQCIIGISFFPDTKASTQVRWVLWAVSRGTWPSQDYILFVLQSHPEPQRCMISVSVRSNASINSLDCWYRVLLRPARPVSYSGN